MIEKQDPDAPTRDVEPALDYPFGEMTPGETVQIADGVILVPIPVPFPPGAVNAVALEDADGWTIVDTGLRGPHTTELWETVIAGPLGGRPIRRVIASHHHPDHIGLAGWFQRTYDAALWASRTAWLYARMLQLDAWTEPPPEANLFMRRCGYDDDMMARYRKRAATNFSVTVEPLPLGVTTIAEGDQVVAGGRRWRVVFGHGHAPDHIVLISQDDDLIIAADQILPKITPNIGVYPTEPDADPLGDWMTSLGALAETIDDSQLILPGHGDPFRGGRARLRRVREKHDRALDRLAAHLTAPRRVVDCFPALYRREIGPALEGLATVESVAHLNHLRRIGRAHRSLDPDGAYVWTATDS